MTSIQEVKHKIALVQQQITAIATEGNWEDDLEWKEQLLIGYRKMLQKGAQWLQEQTT